MALLYFAFWHQKQIDQPEWIHFAISAHTCVDWNTTTKLHLMNSFVSLMHFLPFTPWLGIWLFHPCTGLSKCSSFFFLLDCVFRILVSRCSRHGTTPVISEIAPYLHVPRIYFLGHTLYFLLLLGWYIISNVSKQEHV